MDHARNGRWARLVFMQRAQRMVQSWLRAPSAARPILSCAVTPLPAAVPGAVDAVRLLHQRGYTLHTASGASSTDLELYLSGMGIRSCFGRLYGPDVAGVFKVGPRFYEAIVADAGVAAAPTGTVAGGGAVGVAGHGAAQRRRRRWLTHQPTRMRCFSTLRFQRSPASM